MIEIERLTRKNPDTHKPETVDVLAVTCDNCRAFLGFYPVPEELKKQPWYKYSEYQGYRNCRSCAHPAFKKPPTPLPPLPPKPIDRKEILAKEARDQLLLDF